MRKSLPKGGRLPDGSPAKSSNPRKNAGLSLSSELIEAIATLPQVSSGEWSKSYLVEQVLRVCLGLDSYYEASDLDLVSQGRIVE